MRKMRVIAKHEEIFKGTFIFHVSDKVGRVWQTVGKNGKEAINIIKEGEDTFTFIIEDKSLQNEITVDYIIDALNISKNAFIFIDTLHKVLDTKAKREHFYKQTIGMSALNAGDSLAINRELGKLNKLEVCA